MLKVLGAKPDERVHLADIPLYNATQLWRQIGAGMLDGSSLQTA